MSLRLRLINQVFRLVAKPALARLKDPEKARQGFEVLCAALPITPFVLHLVDHGPVPLHWISVRRRRSDWVILYLHGGGYIAGSPSSHLALAARIARMTGLQIAAPAYLVAPEHPAPAAFDDAVTAHDLVLRSGIASDHIILAGDSAGGGLALALMADLCRRDLRPAGLFAFSPWTDLTMASESLLANAKADPLFPAVRMAEVVEMVRGSLDPADPRISPLKAAFDRPPPVMIQVGSTEILRDDSLRIADVLREAGGKVRLDLWSDCPHVWQMLDGLVPEARKALADVAAFVNGLASGQGLVEADRR